MKVSFEGIGENVVTFYNSSTTGAAAGEPVKISGNGEVSKCEAGGRFFGVALTCEGGFAAVQTDGYVQLAYSGAAPTAGFGMLAADGGGGVKTDADNGGEFLVVDVNTTDKTVGIIL